MVHFFVRWCSLCGCVCPLRTGESCMWCPSCGVCDQRGIIDHCWGAGTAHLSFDDGPLQWTPQILDILKKNGIIGSFWLVGKNIQTTNYNVVQRIAAEGHLIGFVTSTALHCTRSVLNSDVSLVCPLQQ